MTLLAILHLFTSMLLLAIELVVMVVCSGSAKSKLGPIKIIIGLVFGKLHGAARAHAVA